MISVVKIKNMFLKKKIKRGPHILKAGDIFQGRYSEVSRSTGELVTGDNSSDKIISYICVTNSPDARKIVIKYDSGDHFILKYNHRIFKDFDVINPPITKQEIRNDKLNKLGI